MSLTHTRVMALTVALSVAASASAGLIGYYPMDGNANEQTGANINLQLVGDATFVPSPLAGFGQAISLDGDGDGAIGANFVKIAGNDMTGVAWVDANDLRAGWHPIIKTWGQANGGQFHFGLGSGASDTLQNFVGNGANVTAGTPLETGQWYHTAFVVDSASLEQRIYLNGDLIATAAYGGTLTPGLATGLGLGHKPNDDGTALATNGAGPWNGLIDDVGLFDEALSQVAIQDIYQRGLAGIPLGTAVPEPSTAALVVIGLVGGLGWLARRRPSFLNL